MRRFKMPSLLEIMIDNKDADQMSSKYIGPDKLRT